MPEPDLLDVVAKLEERVAVLLPLYREIARNRNLWKAQALSFKKKPQASEPEER